MNKIVHTRRPKGTRNVVRFLRKLWKRRRALVHTIVLLAWIVHQFIRN